MTAKPYCLTIDRGAPGVFFRPIYTHYETEAEARDALAREMEVQKAEMAKAGGRCVCVFELTRYTADGKEILTRETLTQGDFPSPAITARPEYYENPPAPDEKWGNLGVVAGGPQLAAMARRKQEIAERRGRGEL